MTSFKQCPRCTAVNAPDVAYCVCGYSLESVPVGKDVIDADIEAELPVPLPNVKDPKPYALLRFAVPSIRALAVLYLLSALVAPLLDDAVKVASLAFWVGVVARLSMRQKPITMPQKQTHRKTSPSSAQRR